MDMLILMAVIIVVLIGFCVYFAVALQRSRHSAAEVEVLRRLLDEETAKVESLTAELLEHEAEAKGAKELQSVLVPLRERIDMFSRSFADARVRDAAVNQSLHDQLERLMNLNASIGNEARALTDALRGNSKIQGDWGEMVLERLLEESGMVKGVNFEIQVTRGKGGEVLRDDEGNMMRPDVVIMLPEDRHIVVDSKVSLTDYVRMCEASDDESRDRYRRRHIMSVRRHIDELAAKRYDSVVDKSADQVLMFMPVEGAFLAAYSESEDLWSYACRKGIVIVSPAHLSSVLQLVMQLWRSDKQDRNAIEIARQAGLLYDRFVQFTEELKKIERALQTGMKAYGECVRRLSEGRVSLVSRAEKLRDLGAKTSKQLSERLTHEAGSLEKETE